MRSRLPLVIGLAIALTACGGATDPGGDDPSDSEETGGGTISDGTATDAPEVSDDAMATVVIDGQTYIFEANEWTVCDLSDEGDPFPLGPDGYFGEGERIEAPNADHDYLEFYRAEMQFFWSGKVAGEFFQENYHPDGESDAVVDLTDDTFRYSDSVGSVSIEVTC